MDVGQGESGSVKFFNQFPCCLYFLNLYDKPSQAVYAPFTDLPAGIRFDVCLLWDYLNFLDEEQLTLFIHSLRSFIHAKTLIHAVIAYSTYPPLQRLRYNVDEGGSIILKSNDSVRVPYPHTLAEVVHLWPQFILERATILHDNRLELVAREGSALR